MLQQDFSSDYVVVTGICATARNFAGHDFNQTGLEWEVHGSLDKSYMRPTEVDSLIDDPLKAKRVLGWEAKTTWRELEKLMIEHTF